MHFSLPSAENNNRRTVGQRPLPDLGTLDQNAQSPKSGALQLQVTSKKYHAHKTKESSSHQIFPANCRCLLSLGLSHCPVDISTAVYHVKSEQFSSDRKGHPNAF